MNRENSRGMINRFGWKRGCVGGVSLHQRKATAQCHFNILQQLKSAMVHSKTSLREVSSSRSEGVLTIGGMGR